MYHCSLLFGVNFFFLSFFLMCICVWSVFLSVRELDPPELELQTVVSPSGCCELNPGPLEEQTIFPAAEPFL